MSYRSGRLARHIGNIALCEISERIPLPLSRCDQRGEAGKFVEADAQPEAGFVAFFIVERLEEIGPHRRIVADDGIVVGTHR